MLFLLVTESGSEVVEISDNDEGQTEDRETQLVRAIDGLVASGTISAEMVRNTFCGGRFD